MIVNLREKEGMRTMDENKKKAAIDFASGIGLTAIGVYIVIEALNMKVYNSFLDAPGFFPTIVGGVIAVLGAVLAFIGFRLGGAGALGMIFGGHNIKRFITAEGTIRVVILTLFMVVYIYGLLGRIHFIAATSIYLVTNFLYLKANKHWWVSVLIAVGTSVVVYYAFKLGFGITMP